MSFISSKSSFIQLAWTLFLSMQVATVSFSNAWPSYTIQLLENDASPLGFKLTKYQSNLVGSIPMAGSVIATLAAGTICDAIGRKKAYILASLIFGVAWSLVLTARSFTQILIARSLTGLSSGLAVVVVFVYVGEITQSKIRGVTSPMLSLMYNVGVLASYLLGWFCSYEEICHLCVTGTVFHTLVMIVFVKDTPGYFLSVGEDKAALASLKFYRGEYTSETSEAVLEEIAYLKNQSHAKELTDLKILSVLIDDKKQKFKPIPDYEKAEPSNPWKLIVTKDCHRRTLIITVSTVALSVSLGMVALQTYAGQFFTTAAPSMSPDLCSVVLAMEFVVSGIIVTIVTDLVPRRLLMISSCIVVTICLAVLGSLLRWCWGPVWLFPLVIAIYVFVYLAGPINMAYLQMSECFGSEVNSTGTALVLCSMFISNFIVLSFYVPAVDYLGFGAVFFIFAACGVIATVYSILFIKETRNVSIECIQNMFAQGFLYKTSEFNTIRFNNKD